MQHLRPLSWILLVAVVVSGCGREDSHVLVDPPAPLVTTTFYPTTYLAERLLEGTGVPVECPLPAGADPSSWMPDDEAIGAYQRSSLIVLNGAGFESWVGSAALPRSRVVDSTADLPDPLIHVEGATHSHGPGGEHSHGEIDGHTWVDPVLAAAQADAMGGAFVESFPFAEERIEANAAVLRGDLMGLDERWRSLAPRLGAVRVVASHPTYNYVARRYGFEVENLDLDPDQPVPGDALEVLGGAGVQLWWERAPSESAADSLAGLGVVSVVVSPVESASRVGAGADFLSEMGANLDRIEAALP